MGEIDWGNVVFWVVCLFPIWGVLIWEIWQGTIRPRLIPSRLIDTLVLEYILKYGDRAAEYAFINEDRAWRYSDSFEQGKWRRVRRQILQNEIMSLRPKDFKETG